MAFYKNPTGWLIIDCETLCIYDSAVITQVGVTYISDKELKNGRLDGFAECTLESMIKRSTGWKFDSKEQIRLGRTTNHNTLDFWESQPQEIQELSYIPKDTDISITEVFNLIQSYLSEYGARLESVRVADRMNFDVSKLNHLWRQTMGRDVKGSKCYTPYNPYNFWELSQMFKLFTADRYANIDQKSVVATSNFQYHNAIHDAALDAYRMMRTFAGNDPIN